MKLVLLPGLDGTGQLFAPFVQAMPAGIDGDVMSYPTNERLGYDAIRALVLARLPAGEPYIVLGESFSSPIAIEVAAVEPPGLQGVVLSCGFARNPRPLLGHLSPLVSVLPVQGAIAAMVRNTLLGVKDAGLQQSVERSIASVEPAVIRDRLHSIVQHDVTTSVSKIRVPVLYLRATGDRLVPRAAVETIRCHAPHTVLVDIPGPHLLLQTRPDDCARAIQAFATNC